MKLQNKNFEIQSANPYLTELNDKRKECGATEIVLPGDDNHDTLVHLGSHGPKKVR